MIDWLKNEWYNLVKNYSDNEELIDSLWNKIERHYSSKSRYYHDLSHIYNMLKLAKENQSEIINFELFQFAIWYHDIIYKATKKNNEEKSAEEAKIDLSLLKLNNEEISKIQNLILSTKKHEVILQENSDNGYLLDIDLSILCADWRTYKSYIQNIRKEYKIYPKFMYNPARKKILEKFLKREYLYFTNSFRIKYEAQARENLMKEIDSL